MARCDNPESTTSTGRTQLKDFLTMAQAAKECPGRPSSATIWRWITKGVQLPDGRRIHLKGRRVARRWYTTEDWLLDFFNDSDCSEVAPTNDHSENSCASESGTRAKIPEPTTSGSHPLEPIPQQTTASHRQAEAELAAEGL